MSQKFNVNGISPKPDPLASPEEKSKKEYGVSQAKFMYSNFKRNNVNLFHNATSKYHENIAYAQGEQAVDRYKKLLDADVNSNDTWLNLDWTVRNFATKRINIVINMLAEEKYSASFNSIDAFAINEKNMFESDMKQYVAFKETYAKLEQFTGNDMAPMDKDKIPHNLEEAEIYMREDYKHAYAMELEIANQAVLNFNKYEDIKRECAFDMVVNGPMAMYTHLDSHGIPRNKYIDISRLVVPNTERTDYSDIPWAGHLEEVEIGQLKREAGKDLKPENIRDIVDNHSNKVDALNAFGTSHTYPQDYYAEGDMNKVSVMRFCFKTDYHDSYKFKKDKLGNLKSYYDKNPNKGLGDGYEEKTNKDGIKYHTNGKSDVYRDSYPVIFEGTWIIGTEYVYGYKRKTNQSRPHNDPFDLPLPYLIRAPHMKKNHVVSIMGQMRPVIDDIQNYIHRMNAAIAAAMPKGLAIDINGLNQVSLTARDGDNLDIKNLLKLLYEKGILLYSGTSSEGGHINKPVHDLENGMAQDVFRYLDLIQSKIRELDEIIGLNPTTAASSQHPDTGKAVAEMSVQATNNALKHLFEAQRDMFRELSMRNATNFAESIRQGKTEAFRDMIGDSSINFLSTFKETNIHRLGLEVEILPGQQEWNDFYNLLIGSQHEGSITKSDLIFIKRISNLKQAEAAFKSRENKRQREAQEQQSQAIQQNTQAQQQSAEMAADLALRQKQEEEKMKRETMEIEHRFEMERITQEKDLELRNKMNELGQEGQSKNQQIVTNHMLNGETAKFGDNRTRVD